MKVGHLRQKRCECTVRLPGNIRVYLRLSGHELRVRPAGVIMCFFSCDIQLHKRSMIEVEFNQDGGFTKGVQPSGIWESRLKARE